MENFIKDETEIAAKSILFDLQRFVDYVYSPSAAITDTVTVPAEATVTGSGDDTQETAYTAVSLRYGITDGTVQINDDTDVLADGSRIYVSSISGGILTGDLSRWINGAPVTVETISGTGAMDLQLTDYSDTVTIGEITSSGDISLSTGGDADTIRITSISTGKVSIDAGDGDNVVSIGGAINGNADVTISGDTGDDKITINGAINNSTVAVNVGSGNNEGVGNVVLINNSVSGADVTVSGEDGNDLISIKGAIAGSNVLVSVSNGYNTITANTITGGNVSINGGDS